MRRAGAVVSAAALLLACALGEAALQPRSTESTLRGPGGPYDGQKAAGSVKKLEHGRFRFLEGQAQDAVAWGYYVDGSHTRSNFGQLSVSASDDYADEDQVFAAGYLEGVLTAERIHHNWANMREYFTAVMGADLEQPMQWVTEQDAWVRRRCNTLRSMPSTDAAANGSDGDLGDAFFQEGEPSEDAGTLGGANGRSSASRAGRRGGRRFWRAVCLAVGQYDGLVAGYRHAAARSAAAGDGAVPELSDQDLLFMHSSADLYDIIDWLDPSQRPRWDVQGAAPGHAPDEADSKAAADRLFSEVALSGKCSALVKLAPDLSDLFMGHSTWDTYTAMLRIYKHYHLPLGGLRPAASRLSFSSYPGELFSDDDFFILDSGLVILQTTNKVFDDALFEALTPRSVLSWQRVRAAHWLADGGEAWAGVLDTHNSGTYNNQYMVVDLKRFKPGKCLEPGLLWVAEQVPGRVVAADMTAALRLGYWPSFNVPYFPEVYNASGYPDFVSKLERFGQRFTKTTHWLSYESSPRAKIFRRDHSAVTSLHSMQDLMRSNNWRSDPFSEGHPIAAVCGRGDLDAENAVPRGCYDTKVTSYGLALEMAAEVVNGPTRGGGVGDAARNAVLPPFKWRKFDAEGIPHVGQPDRFGFEFERVAPGDLDPAARGGPLQPWAAAEKAAMGHGQTDGALVRDEPIGRLTVA